MRPGDVVVWVAKATRGTVGLPGSGPRGFERWEGLGVRTASLPTALPRVCTLGSSDRQSTVPVGEYMSSGSYTRPALLTVRTTIF